MVLERLHSRYRRLLSDLPWQGRHVTLHVHARRFRCLNLACTRQTFAERLSGTAPAAARRTERLGDLQGHLGLALGGEAGERLAMPISADTLLRMTREFGNDNEPPLTPRVPAVDDWAWRRGRRFGTVLVDLERNTVVDVLPDRQAETLVDWLRRYPGIEIVARDLAETRSVCGWAGAYADGVRQGAPDAVQMTDRWRATLRVVGDLHLSSHPQGSMMGCPVREPCPPKCCYPDVRRSNPTYEALGDNGLNLGASTWRRSSRGWQAERK